MNKFFRALLITVLAICGFIAPVTQASASTVVDVPVAHSSALSDGKTLWSRWKSIPDADRKPWEEYWKESSRLSGIPHTDLAWRKLPVGTIVTSPLSEKVIARAMAQAELVAQARALSDELRQLRQDTNELKIAEAKLATQIDEFNQMLFGAVVFFLVAGIFVARRLVTNNPLPSSTSEKVSQTSDEEFALKSKPAHVETRMSGLPASLAQIEAMSKSSSSSSLRSIELTLHEDEFDVAGRDEAGVRYALDRENTVGAHGLKHGDKFVADVSADNRVVVVFTEVDTAFPKHDVV